MVGRTVGCFLLILAFLLFSQTLANGDAAAKDVEHIKEDTGLNIRIPRSLHDLCAGIDGDHQVSTSTTTC